MKTLKEKAAEVEQVNRDNGWYDDDRTFGEMIALLHSEVSEALEAYRYRGLEDATEDALCLEENWCDHHKMLGVHADKDCLPKPEGVGSEFADVLIRLVDYAVRLNVDLDLAVDRLGPYGRFSIPDSFGDQIADLHTHIAVVYMSYDEDTFAIFSTTPKALATVYRYLCQLCEHHGIDLEAEYNRKLAYNKTRPYRHGGKKL